MNRYTFRLDDIPEKTGISSEEMNSRLKKFFIEHDSVFSRYIIANEIAVKTGKHHYQGVIFTDLKHSTYQKQVYKMFPEWKGKRGDKAGLISLAEVKKDEYIVYTTKDYNFFLIKGFTDSQIDELHKQSYQKVQKTVAVEKDKETMLNLLYKSVPPEAKKWDLVECGIYVQKYYLREFRKFPQDHFAKALMKGLWVMINDRNQNLRMAHIALQWAHGIDEFIDNRSEPKDYINFGDPVVWDDIENAYI